MTATYWNGEPAMCSRVTVIVGPPPKSTWWCADLEGQSRDAVIVGYAGQRFFLDDADGSGWAKVTDGRGSPRVPHRGLPDSSKIISADVLTAHRELDPRWTPEEPR